MSDSALNLTPDQKEALDHKMGIIHILTGTTAKGEDFFAYVSVKPTLYEEFCRRIEATEKMNVKEFGQILHKGFGKEPSESDRQYVQKKYGIDPDYMEKFVTAFENFVASQKTAR